MSDTFTPTFSRPADFDGYWATLLDELRQIPMAPTLDSLPLRSTDFATCYQLHFTSHGPYRLFAYYNVPHGDGPFPAILSTPGYASVVGQTPYEERRRYVSMSLAARGQRGSDRPFAASFPGLATVGVDHASAYVYRGIVADTVRAIDFLLSRREVDARQILLSGNDTALIGAALRPSVAAVMASDPAFYAARDLARRTSAYPQEEWNEYARSFPAIAEPMWKTLSYFDPLTFAPRITAAVRLSVGPPGSPFSRETAGPLVEAIAGSVDIDERTGYGFLDYNRALAWRDSQLG